MTTVEQLATVLGDGAFRRLIHAFGGRVLRVPKMETESRSQRRRRSKQISDELDCRCANPRHHSYRTIAKRHGVSVGCVARIAKQPNPGYQAKSRNRRQQHFLPR